VTLLTDLDAFYTDHRLCGLDAGVDGPRAGRRLLTRQPGRSSTRDHHATFARTCS
jgi:hypothetical protein